MIHTQRLILVPAPLEAVESLIHGDSNYLPLYDQVAEGYIEFPDALEYTAEQLRHDPATGVWGTYLFILDRCLIGVGGY